MKSKIMTVIDAKSYSLSHPLFSIHLQYANSILFFFSSLSFLSLQRSFFCRLTGDSKSEKFFKVFYERMKLAQQEIKATVTVNTSDLGSKRKDEDANDKDNQTRKKGQSSACPIIKYTHHYM